jgi:hypothetical protein
MPCAPPHRATCGWTWLRSEPRWIQQRRSSCCCRRGAAMAERGHSTCTSWRPVLPCAERTRRVRSVDDLLLDTPATAAASPLRTPPRCTATTTPRSSQPPGSAFSMKQPTCCSSSSRPCWSWRATPADAENLNAAFRAAHTIKGTAGLFGCDAVVLVHPRGRDPARSACAPAQLAGHRRTSRAALLEGLRPDGRPCWTRCAAARSKPRVWQRSADRCWVPSCGSCTAVRADKLDT